MSKRFESILVPVDFSDASRDAAGYAQELARAYDARFTLLHVVPPFDFGFSMAELPGPRHEQVEARNRAAAIALESFADLTSDAGLRRELREGAAAEEIIAHAHAGKFDLIVMPTRGGGALQRLLRLGSVTAKVLSAAECPVLTGVHLRRPGGEFSLNSIVCAIDLGNATERVLCQGARLAADFGARLTIVHAAPGGDAAADVFDDTWRTAVIERLRHRIEDLSHRIGEVPWSAGNTAEIVVEAGDPPKVITAAAASANADLLVLGRGESHDLLGRLRANAYDVIRQSQAAVMSV